MTELAPDYEAIAVRWLPRGYRVEYPKGLTGMHYGDRALIKAPRPTTPNSLYIFLHECAHAYLHTGTGKHGKVYMKELEAELWAHAKMAEHGIPVPPEMTEQAKRYVARKLVQAERRGGKNFDPRAIEFAGEYLAAKRAQYVRIYGKSRQPRAHTQRLAALRARTAIARETAIARAKEMETAIARAEEMETPLHRTK